MPPPGANLPPKEDKMEKHARSYGLVYANEIARAGLFTTNWPKFQTGAMIVREKLAAKNSQAPELLAIMIKREKGFNPRANDWEFLLVNGAANKIERREKTGACLDCHRSHPEKDFIYGTYDQ